MKDATFQTCSQDDALRAAWSRNRQLADDLAQHAAECPQCRRTLRCLQEFAELAAEPVGRGPEAADLWARAAVVRRLQKRDPFTADDGSAIPAWSPLLGGAVALSSALVVWLWAGSNPYDGAALVGVLAGSLGVLGLATLSSLVLLWNEL